MKVVLDSNVIVAAFSSNGLCNAIFELCLDRCTISTSEYILSEVHKNLQKKLKLPVKNTDIILEYLREVCEIKKYAKLKTSVCRDKDDDEVLALAKSSHADYIISGDKDLLVLKTFNSTRIVSPREFWNIAKEKGE